MDIRDVQSRDISPDDEPSSQTRHAAPADHGVRSERVEAVRDKLADGTLVVDQQRIARGLLERGIVRF